jgi:hypothetical protein
MMVPMPQISPSAIIGRALEIYRSQFATLIGASLLLFAVSLVVTLVLPDELVSIAGLVSLIVSAFYTGMVVQLVRDLQDGHRDSSIGELFRSVAPYVLPLIVVAFLFGIGIAIGFILLIVPGLFLLTIWALVMPVTVIESPGILAAFGRSRELVRGNGWNVFGVIVLLFVINIVVGVVAFAIGSALGDVGEGVLSWLANALVAPLTALATSVLYFALAGAREPVATDGVWTPPTAGGPQPV